MIRSLKRRWRWLCAVVLAGLLVNVWLHDGVRVLAVLLVASTAFLLLVFFEFVVTGASVAHHARRVEESIKAIDADRARKELTR
jgi:cobalamin biosynthesis protein CobD/CbiB